MQTCEQNFVSLRFVNNLPSSWGTSSQMTAKETLTPDRMLSVKAAPIDKPSIKLCKPSPKIIIQATVATSLWCLDSIADLQP